MPEVRIEWLQLLERVSKDKRGVQVDAGKVDEGAVYRDYTEEKRERAKQFLKEHAPDRILRPEYWLEARFGRVQSRPNLQILHDDVFVPSPGSVRVEPSLGVEALVGLRDSGPFANGLADAVVRDRVRLWDWLAGVLGQEDGVEEGTPAWKELRMSIKREVFRMLYGMRPSGQWGETEAEVAAQKVLAGRLEVRYPGLLLVGTKEKKRKTLVRRNHHATGVWLEVALEAERLGCRVTGFWLSEPLLEAPQGTDVDVMASRLVEHAYGLLA